MIMFDHENMEAMVYNVYNTVFSIACNCFTNIRWTLLLHPALASHRSKAVVEGSQLLLHSGEVIRSKDGQNAMMT